MYAVGDILVGRARSTQGLAIKIKQIIVPTDEEVNELRLAAGDVLYVWEYADLQSSDTNEFYSGNGADPLLSFLWKKKNY